MVAQKRGRGGKAAQAKAKAAAPVEEEQAAAAAAEDDSVEPMEENNGAAEAETGDGEAEAAGDEAAGEAKAEGADQSQEEVAADGEAKPEEPKEEKVEPGKILVENMPTSCLFDYQEKLKELFSKHGEVSVVKRGPIIVTEQTTTPTLSAIVEFKNKESLEKVMAEKETLLDGKKLTLTVECRAETTVLVGVPYEVSTEYVHALMSQCGVIAQLHEFSKTKYKIWRVTYQERESVETALKLDRELRINGFLVTVSKYRDEEDQRQHNANAKNKRQHPQQQIHNPPNNMPVINTPPAVRTHNFRNRGGGGGGGGGGGFNARGGGGVGFRGMAGGRGRGGFPARGGAFPRGGYAGGINSYMPPAPYMPRPQGGFMNDGQRPNKRLRQM